MARLPMRRLTACVAPAGGQPGVSAAVRVGAVPCVLAGVLVGALAAGLPARAQDPRTESRAAASTAADLRSRFAAVARQPGYKLSDRPIHLLSAESGDELRGDVYAVVDHRFADVRQALASARPWCDVLILHLNIKYCRLLSAASRDTLEVGFGRKLDASLSALQWLRFEHRTPAAGDDLLRVEMTAASGPMSTSDYRIVVEAAGLSPQQTVLHFGYAYRYGAAARFAMRAYLSTAGSDKVGFSVVGRAADGQPVLVGGTRGVLERNTMRYFLAVEAFLSAERAPAAERQERRLTEWFTATERYARQLHEVDREDYLQMKRMELHRQATTVPPPGS